MIGLKHVVFKCDRKMFETLRVLISLGFHIHPHDQIRQSGWLKRSLIIYEFENGKRQIKTINRCIFINKCSNTDF